jgi:putative serine protease PepD
MGTSARTRARPAAVALVAIVALVAAVLTGCGGNGKGDRTVTTVAAPVSMSMSDLQSQFVHTVKTVSPKVVEVETSVGLGSGVVFDSRGDIVTNAHVVGNAHRVSVTLAGGQQHSATVVGSDTKNDVAVIRLAGATPAPARFADSSQLEVGDLVLAIGNPLGLRSSVTQGIVSSLGRSVTESAAVTLSAIQTSAAINPGNSGGALVALDGGVVGIPTLAALDPEFGNAQASGIGFAIPSNTVRSVADRLIGDA